VTCDPAVQEKVTVEPIRVSALLRPSKGLDRDASF